jgi:hypothetical protein
MASNHLTELASTIAENTKVTTEYLISKNIPPPSFEADGLDGVSISPEDKDAFAERSKLVAATRELDDMTVGPKIGLRHLAWNV